jgi:hypothetical protein
MTVYLLRLDDGRTLIFYGVPDPVLDEELASHGGVRGWLTRKYRNLKDALESAEHGPGAWARRVWHWLRRWTSPDEPMLRALRSADRLTLAYPASISPDEARAAWCQYLAARLRRHGLWLTINLLIAPLTILLIPVPGPNVIGFWVVYRAICHTLALLGIRRSRARTADAKLVPYDEPEPWASDAERISHFEARHGLDGIAAYVQEAAPRRARPVAEPVGAQDRCDS